MTSNTYYTLTSIMSLPYIPHPWGTNVLNVNIPPCCHIFLQYIMGFDIKLIHQSIKTKHSHASCCHYCHCCKVDYFLMDPC